MLPLDSVVVLAVSAHYREGVYEHTHEEDGDCEYGSENKDKDKTARVRLSNKQRLCTMGMLSWCGRNYACDDRSTLCRISPLCQQSYNLESNRLSWHR